MRYFTERASAYSCGASCQWLTPYRDRFVFYHTVSAVGQRNECALADEAKWL
jgi:hypothetical protein